MHMHVLERIKPGGRVVGAESIELPSGYSIQPVATNLSYPTAVSWDPDGNMLIAEGGFPYGRAAAGEARILRLNPDGSLEPVISGFERYINDITVYRGMLYVSQQGKISVVEDGHIRDLISGLPSWGLHQNGTIVFGADEHMYFAQGSVSNAGIIGPLELAQLQRSGHLEAHDIPGASLTLVGTNYESTNPVTHEKRPVGAFSAWGKTSAPGAQLPGALRGQAASGAIMRAPPDGSDLRVYAWGLRNPAGLVFGPDGRLYATNQGARALEPRPIAGDPDTLWAVEEGIWYGWPDYFAGEPVNERAFGQPGGAAPEFLIANHQELLGGHATPKPLLSLGVQPAAAKLDFCLRPAFGFAGQIFLAESGSLVPPSEGTPPCTPEGHRIVRIDLAGGTSSDFAINRSRMPASMTGNNGGLERPVEAKFGPDGSLFIVDFGVVDYREDLGDWAATEATGIVWQVTRTS